MRWRVLGHIFNAAQQAPFMHSHAAYPIPEYLGNGLLRILFTTRDAQKRSHLASLVINLSAPQTVLDLSTTALLAPGEIGTFDDSGVTAGCLVPHPDGDRLYYMGWNLGVLAPWRNALGVALRPKGQTHFTRLSPGPLLDRSPADPYTLSYGHVLQLGAHDWRWWYGSCTSWGNNPEAMRHAIKLARSTDGINWQRDGQAVLAPQSPDIALSRPWLLQHNGQWHMWYSRRAAGGNYVLARAVSADLAQWQNVGDEVFNNADDTKQYAATFMAEGALYLIYASGRFGDKGLALAIAENP